MCGCVCVPLTQLCPPRNTSVSDPAPACLAWIWPGKTRRWPTRTEAHRPVQTRTETLPSETGKRDRLMKEEEKAQNKCFMFSKESTVLRSKQWESWNSNNSRSMWCWHFKWLWVECLYWGSDFSSMVSSNNKLQLTAGRLHHTKTLVSVTKHLDMYVSAHKGGSESTKRKATLESNPQPSIDDVNKWLRIQPMEEDEESFCYPFISCFTCSLHGFSFIFAHRLYMQHTSLFLHLHLPSSSSTASSSLSCSPRSADVSWFYLLACWYSATVSDKQENRLETQICCCVAHRKTESKV